MVYFFAGAVVGFLFGIASRFIFAKSSYDGEFKVDTSDPLKDKYMLELNTALYGIEKKKQLVLKVVPIVEKTHSNIEED